MENPIKMDDLGGKPTIFGNIHIEIPAALDVLKVLHDGLSKNCGFLARCPGTVASQVLLEIWLP